MTTPMISFGSLHDPSALAASVREVIASVPYYNAQAIQAELAKYTSEHLGELIRQDPHSILVSRDAEGINGFCISGWDDGTIWLYWFGVAPRARGRGLGGELLKALGATLPSRGAHKIWCDSRTDNMESIAALQSVGFRKLVRIDNHWFNQDYYLWEWIPATG